MTAIRLQDRNLYKSIVIGMSICLPVGLGIGIVYNQVPIGILAGNTAGILLGLAISRINRNQQEKYNISK